MTNGYHKEKPAKKAPKKTAKVKQTRAARKLTKNVATGR